MNLCARLWHSGRDGTLAHSDCARVGLCAHNNGGRVAAAGGIPTVAPALAGTAPVEVVGVVNVTPPLTASVGADEAAAVGEGVGGGAGDDPPDLAHAEADAAAGRVGALWPVCCGRLQRVGLVLVPRLGRCVAGRGHWRWVEGGGKGQHPMHSRRRWAQGGGGSPPAASTPAWVPKVRTR